MNARLVLPWALGLSGCGMVDAGEPVGTWTLSRYRGSPIPAVRPAAIHGEGTEIRGGQLRFRANATFDGVIVFVIRDSGEYLDSARIYGTWAQHHDSLYLTYHYCNHVWCPYFADSTQGIVRDEVIETRSIPGVFDAETTFTKED